MSKQIILLMLSAIVLADAVLGNIQIVPPILELTVQRGRRAEFFFSIRNTDDNEVPSVFEVFDMDISEEGKPIISDGSYERGCASWIELQDEQVNLKARDVFTLEGTISVPDTVFGSYYAIIRGDFTGTTIPFKDEAGKLQDTAIALKNQAIVVLMITVQSSRNRPMLFPDTLLINPHGGRTAGAALSSNKKNGWSLTLPIRNNGSIHTQVTGRVSIWSPSGLRIEGAPLEGGRGYVLPGKVRNFTASGEQDLPDGLYMVRFHLATKEGVTITESLPFGVMKGKSYPGQVNDELKRLIALSSPGFRMKYPLLEKQVTPGGSIHLPIELYSASEDTLFLKPELIDWALNPKGGIAIAGIDTTAVSRSCKSWMELPEDVFIVPPGRRKFFIAKVNVPDSINGEYYTGIIFKPANDDSPVPREFLSDRSQLITLSETGNLRREVVVDTLLCSEKTGAEQDTVLFSFVVRNKGNVRCFARGTVSFEEIASPGIYVDYGKPVSFGGYQTVILPDGVRDLEVQVPPFDPGEYRVVVSVSFDRELPPVNRYRTFKFD